MRCWKMPGAGEYRCPHNVTVALPYSQLGSFVFVTINDRDDAAGRPGAGQLCRQPFGGAADAGGLLPAAFLPAADGGLSAALSGGPGGAAGDARHAEFFGLV